MWRLGIAGSNPARCNKEWYPSGKGAVLKTVRRDERARVRIPPAPPNKHRNFDTKRIRIAVLSFCPKALIASAFGLLRILLMPSRSIAHW